MTEDVDQFVGSCNICQQAKDPKYFKKDEELFHLWTALFILFTVGKRSKKGHKYVPVMTDAFSKLLELVPIPDKEAERVAAWVRLSTNAIWTHSPERSSTMSPRS